MIAGYTTAGFLRRLPEDFVEVMNTTTHGNLDENGNSITAPSKVFLPGATNMFAKTGKQPYNSSAIVYETAGDGESQVWEYWQDRMILEQSVNDYIVHPEQATYRITNQVGGTPLPISTYILLPNKVYLSANDTNYLSYVAFDYMGYYLALISYTGKFLPACVIG